MSANNKDQQYLQQCVKEIEQHLDWGECSTWRQREFNQLSQLIQNQVGVMISVSTLKRLFGRTSYRGTPQPNTLNALVRFIGYQDWYQFIEEKEKATGQAPTESSDPQPEPPPKPSASKKPNKTWVAIVLALLVGAGLLIGLLIYHSGPTEEKTTPSKQRASAEQLKAWLKQLDIRLEKNEFDSAPATAVWHYDMSQIKPKATFTFDYDKDRKLVLGKNDKIISKTFYSPGIYNVHLNFNGETAKTFHIIVKSNGWRVLSKKALNKRHFSLEPYMNGKAYVSPEEIEQLKKKVKDKNHKKRFLSTRYRLVQPFSVSGDAYRFKTRLRHHADSGSNVCQRVAVKVHGKYSFHEVYLVKTGCMQKVQLFYGGKVKDGQSNDFSAFELDMNQFQQLEMQAQDQQFIVSLNGKEVFRDHYPQKLGPVVMLSYTFSGHAGEVEEAYLYDQEGNLVYGTEFEGPRNKNATQ